MTTRNEFNEQAAHHTPESRWALAGVLRRRRWVMLPLAMLPVLAFILTSSQPAEYSASAQVLLNERDLGPLLAGLPSGSQDAPRATRTQAALVRLPNVADEAGVTAGFPPGSGTELRDSISVETSEVSDIITITAIRQDRDEARRLANAFAQVSTDYRRSIDTSRIAEARRQVEKNLQTARQGPNPSQGLIDTLVTRADQLRSLELVSGTQATVVQTADTVSQVGPKPIQATLVSLPLAVVLALLFAYGAEALDRRVRTADQVEQVLGVPILGEIPILSRRLAALGGVVMRDRENPAATEPFRIAEARLRLAMAVGNHRTVVLTSAEAGEGKTTTVANLALAAGEAGRNVWAVDADLRRPSLAAIFAAPPRPGLTEFLAGYARLDDVARDLEVSTALDRRTARLVPAGAKPPNPSEYLGSHRARELFETLSRNADIVFIDAPPAVGLGDVLTLAPLCDAVVAVVDLSSASRRSLERLLAALGPIANEKLVGAIVTHSRVRPTSYYYGREDASPRTAEPAAHLFRNA